MVPGRAPAVRRHGDGRADFDPAGRYRGVVAEFSDSLRDHFGSFAAAPFLFVGSGIPRRYLDLDDWESLLRRMAALTGKEFDYFSASANGDNPTIASLIAEALHDPWWNERRFEETRKRWANQRLRTRESALKAEVSSYAMDALETLPASGDLRDELDLLGQAVVDGVITTNYDPLLEAAFPDFRVFVGQEELLFEDPQGVGELYKIHGSCSQPDSIVITRDDYDDFDRRNPYLAAKLMTIFVEHPVVFLGYSLTDPNVGSILRSIVTCLSSAERIATLADRLIFVQWERDATPSMTRGVIPVDGHPIPVVTVTVPDFNDVFAALAGLRRAFPAKLLRQLKEQVYDLVLEGDPKGRLHVLPLDDKTDLSSVELVFGVGAIAQLRSYVGLSRDDLVDDILDDGADLQASRVVHEAIPNILSHPGNVPIYKYLRQAGLLNETGDLIDAKTVDSKIANHVTARKKRLALTDTVAKSPEAKSARKLTLKELVANEDPGSVLQHIPALSEDDLDPGELRRFLIRNEDLRHHRYHASQWIKMTCLYDWLLYGRQKKPKPRRGRKPTRKSRRTER